MPAVVFGLGVEANEGVVQIPETICPMSTARGGSQYRDVAEGTQPACHDNEVHSTLVLEYHVSTNEHVPANLHAGEISQMDHSKAWAEIHTTRLSMSHSILSESMTSALFKSFVF